MDNKIEEDLDRISELPIFIIHQIMSYLSPEEAARTSVLSKNWNRLWSSFPILDLDKSYFISKTLCESNLVCTSKSIKNFRETLKKFINFVDASLVRFWESKLCIQKLGLHIRLLDVRNSYSLVDRWIALAMANEVRELDLDIISTEKTKYTLPPRMFCAKFLTTLRLSGCMLEEFSDSIGLQSLKKLTLDEICISGEMLQRLTSECPLLEDLFISCCRGSKFLSVGKSINMKILTIDLSSIEELESIKIVAPSLEQLSLFFLRKGSRWPVNETIDCPNLNKLDLHHANFTDQEFHHFISNFPLLEDLSVCGCEFLQDIAVSSSHLRNLSLACCPNLKAIDVDTPNLLSFSYKNESIPTLSINDRCPLEFLFSPNGDIDSRWYLNIKEFIGFSNQIKDLGIYVMPRQKISFNSEEFRISSCSFPREVEKLSLILTQEPSNYSDLLNGVLSICFPKTLSVHTEQSGEPRFHEWVYEELRNARGKVSCCSTSSIKCWRHYLKDVKIESFFHFHSQKLFNMDDLLDAWPNLPGGALDFHVDWCFPSLN